MAERGLTVLASLSVPLVALRFAGPSFLPSAPVSIEQLWFAVVIMYLRQFVFGPTETFGVLPATALILFVEIPVALAAAWVLHRWAERPHHSLVDQSSTAS